MDVLSPSDVAPFLEYSVGASITSSRPLTGELEADAFAAETDHGCYVLKVSPAWRDDAELEWAASITDFVTALSR